MKLSLTTAGNINSRAKSWSLVLLACVICNLGLTSTAEGATVRDEFDAISYSGNNGTVNWSGDWIEFGETQNPNSGFVQVSTDGPCTAGNCLRLGIDGNNNNKGADREANLTGAASATFTYNYSTDQGDRGFIHVEVSGNGGSTWSNLITYDVGSSGSGSESFNIAGFIAADTQVRFRGTNRDDSPGSSEQFRGFMNFDNIQIQYFGGVGTYYWQRDTGTSVAGFTTDTSPCGAEYRDEYRITLMVTGGFNCGEIRHEGRDPTPQNLWLMIKNIPYVVPTEVTGITFALNFEDDSSGGVTARYELGYAIGGVFTSFGFADEGPHTSQSTYVTDLSAISGIAPAGSSLALRILDVAPSSGDMRMFTGSSTGGGILNVFETAGGAPANPAVTSAVAEISPNDVTTSSTGNAFSYDILATIGGSDTGVNRVEITLPGTFGAPTVTGVEVGGSPVGYTDNTSGNTISVDLTVKVTSTSQITVLFDADAPTTQDLTGVDFLSTVDDSGTGDAAQSTTEGNGDGDAGDNNSWTVTTTSPPGPQVCQVDPTGTYIEAENFTGTIVQGSAFFTESTAQPGYNGSGYLLSNGGGTDAAPVHEGKIYNIEFTTAGVYNVWLRGYATGGGADSLFIGLNGTAAGALTEGPDNAWVWTNTIQLGSNQITVPGVGFHDFNAWIRESGHSADGFYLTQGGETPTGGIPPGVPELDPTACVGADADLALTKTDSADPVPVSTPFTYTLTATNNGPGAANNVTLVDTLPVDVAFQSATPSQGICVHSGEPLGGTVTCSLGTIANAANATVDIEVDSPITVGEINNSATVSADETDPVPADNTANEPTDIVVNQANLRVIKVDDLDPNGVNLPIVYTVTITNQGPGAATGVTLVDTLDAATTYVSAVPSQGSCLEAAGEVTCDLLALANGISATVVITATAPGTPQTVTNTAVVSGVEPDFDLGDNTVLEDTVITNPPPTDLQLTKTDSPDPVVEGNPLTYTLTVTNLGPGPATNVLVVDTLPAGVTFISATPSTGSCNPPGPTVDCDLNTLSNGAVETIVIVVTAPIGAGVITNNAVVSTTRVDPVIPNNSASADTVVTVPGGADISLSKSDSPDPVNVVQTLSYTLTVDNLGPDPATDVVLVDTLPATVAYQSVVPSQGSCIHSGEPFGGTVTCTMGVIANAANATANIFVTAPVSPGSITNNASISTSAVDGNPANDTASEDTTVVNLNINQLCYLVADAGGGNGGNDLLTRIDTADFDPVTNETNIGTGTGTFSIEAIAWNSATSTLYGADAGRLGILNTTTGVFAALPSTFGTGTGALGAITFTDVDGLAYDATSGILFGVEVQGGTDVMIQINMATGAYVPDAFGAGIDYVPLPPILGNSITDDIAVDPLTGIMYAAVNAGGSTDRLITINKATGATTDVALITVPDIEGLGTDVTGQLWGTSGTQGILYEISKTTGVGSNGRTINNGSDYEAVDCDQLSPGVVADLGVTKGVDNATPNEGSTINYTIVVTNNGPATATVIQISDVLPAGVTYVSDTPTQGSYDSFTGNWFVGSLAVSSTATLTIQASVDAGTAGSTITNTAAVTFLIQSDPNPANDSASVDIDPVTSCPGGIVLTTADSGASSLRECIIYANGIPGTTVTFDIPGPGNRSAGADTWWGIAPAVPLPTVTAAGTVIDATTQTTNQGDTNSRGPEVEIDGAGAGAGANGLVLGAASTGSTIRGLAIGNFSDNGILLLGSSNIVAGNYLGLSADGDTVAANNPSATNQLGGIRVESASNTIGGIAPADRNVISGNGFAGIELFGAAATTNEVYGNYIGIDATGTLNRGNTDDGINIQLASSNIIGGPAAGQRNILSGNGSDGIDINGGDFNVVQGNYVGTDITGTLTIGNARDGIDVQAVSGDGTTGTMIGGTGVNEGNLIRGNLFRGVHIKGNPTTNNSVLGNRIFGSSQLDIELSSDGITVNDTLDADVGPNDLLNYPEIVAATEVGAILTTYFNLDVPAGDYRIEFFANPSGANPSGNGGGEVFAGARMITHAGAGVELFSHAFPGAAGDVITSTATERLAGPTYASTSEFSTAFTATALAPFTAHWPLDETSGTVAVDVDAGNNGTYQNGVLLNQFAACSDTGNAVYFDGVDDFVEVPHSADYLIDEGTVSFWANVDALGTVQSLFSKDSTGFDTGGHLTINVQPGGQVRVSLQSSTGDNFVNSAPISPGTWFHVAFTWGPAGMALYIDGAAPVTNPYAGGLGTTSGGAGNFEPIAFGASTKVSGNLVVTPTEEYLAGYMDEVQIINRALSLPEIQTLATCTPSLNIVKRAFWPDGTPIPSGVDIPSGVEFKYLLYINNTGGAVTDVSVRDALDPAFVYQTPSIQVDNSVAECALATCDPGEEAAIFTAVDGTAVLTDATSDDVVSYTAPNIDAGNENAANLQLDISGSAVWAILFSVQMP